MRSASFRLLLSSLVPALGLGATVAIAAAQPAPADPVAPTEPTPVDAVPATTAAPVEGDAYAPIAPTPVTEPAPAAASEKPAIHVEYDKGIVFKTADDDFEMKLALRSQMRFQADRSFEDGAEFENNFSLPRTRLQLEGHAFGAAHRYKLEVALGDKGGFAFVKEFFVDWKVGDKVYVRTGQARRPFSRQELTSDYGSAFNERSIANEFAGGGRDLGVSLHNDYESSPAGLEWVVGVYNGFSGGADRPKVTTTCTQDPTTLEISCSNSGAQNYPTDFSPALVGRVGFNHGKIKGYSDIDLEGGPLRAAVALDYKIDLANFDKGTQASVADNMSHGIGIDAMVKAEGFDATAGVFAMKLKSADLLVAGYAQAGYLVVPKKVHLAGRFAFAQLDADNTEIEARAAFSYLLKGHQLKIASDVGILKATGEKADLQVRVMPQLTF